MSTLSAPQRIALLESMLAIRAHEEQLAALATPTSPGTCTSVGQEAAAVGVVRALESRDRLLTNHRSAGHLVARGADHGRLMAEVMGRRDGYCKGKSGSLHISARDLGVVLTSTIVGGELSLAPGVALAQKMGASGTEPGGLTAVFFGDGAACEGIFHESVNLAVTWRLPLLFVCENNQWQAYVRRDETMPQQHVADWVHGHGIEARVVDGNDVEAVHDAARQMAAAIRADGRPRLLELTTYRLRGHFEPDDQAYVDADELRAWQARDPIDAQAARLLAERVLTPAELAHVKDRVAATVAAALDFAQASPWPDASELTTDVYA
ncbi:thiamine pyrophosphate-dependent dehydrogenase E1 component subunit alpha [Ideonella sp. A 288]|uniref:thiamine pyrophosphate-dependent dehydrogenase E1 component subunit alpha n=1 Tax=Ideonella sp. A 288 TaxID=1962181 RepID=UPI000B4A73E1|nr:thiamine pyrophosphate-dependent dehydrogenase E1 component subunit alpha [Ideonella sp. A 288]